MNNLTKGLFMPIIEIALGCISGGMAICGFVWKVHNTTTKRQLDHEKRLSNIEHNNDIQNIQIENLKTNHVNLDARMARLEDNVTDLKITTAEILQILKGGFYGKTNKNMDK